MSTAVPGFDLAPEEKAPIVEAMAAAARKHILIRDEYLLSGALAEIGNALLKTLTAEQCDRLSAAKRNNI